MPDEQKPRPQPKSKLKPITSEAAAIYARTQLKMDGGIPEAGTDRWLWGNGVLSEGMKQNFMLFGYVAHPGIKSVELVVPEESDPEKPRSIEFKVWLPRKELQRYLRHKKLVRWLTGSGSLFWRWILVKVLERGDQIDIDRNIRRSVREYLGTETQVQVTVMPWSGQK